jgi:hypothetical protein
VAKVAKKIELPCFDAKIMQALSKMSVLGAKLGC